MIVFYGEFSEESKTKFTAGALRSSRNYGYGDSYWKDQLTSWGSYGTSFFAYDR